MIIWKNIAGMVAAGNSRNKKHHQIRLSFASHAADLASFCIETLELIVSYFRSEAWNKYGGERGVIVKESNLSLTALTQ